MSDHQRGMYGMYCFNGLSDRQKKRLVEWGNLEFGFKPDGPCTNPAEIEIITVWDVTPGPRMYCRRCAVEYIYQVDRDEASVRREQERIRLTLEATQHVMTQEEYERLTGW